MNLNEFARGFRAFGHFIADIINFVLLLLVFAIAIGPVSLINRASKKHFLDFKNKSCDSYYDDIAPENKKLEDYYNQF